MLWGVQWYAGRRSGWRGAVVASACSVRSSDHTSVSTVESHSRNRTNEYKRHFIVFYIIISRLLAHSTILLCTGSFVPNPPPLQQTGWHGLFFQDLLLRTLLYKGCGPWDQIYTHNSISCNSTIFFSTNNRPWLNVYCTTQSNSQSLGSYTNHLLSMGGTTWIKKKCTPVNVGRLEIITHVIVTSRLICTAAVACTRYTKTTWKTSAGWFTRSYTTAE